MKRIDRIYSSLAILIAVLAPSQFAFAAIDKFPNLFVYSDKVVGECIFGISNEPYSAINADCKTLHVGEGTNTRLALEPISGFDLGFPHNEYHDFRWDTLYTGTTVSEGFYCQIFGISEFPYPPVIRLGHHSDPDQNRDEPGASICKPRPEQYKVFWQPFCWGAFGIVYGFNAVFESGAISYRAELDPVWICWVVAGIGGE